MDFDVILKAVDVGVIVAIMLVTQGLKNALPEAYWRVVPLIPLVLGIFAGIVMTEVNIWRLVAKNSLLYAGASSLVYEVGRTTVFGRGAKAENLEATL